MSRLRLVADPRRHIHSYLRTLDSGHAPRLLPTHGPDAPTPTYDELVAEFAAARREDGAA